MGMEFGDLESFRNKLEVFSKFTDAILRESSEEVTARILTLVIKGTPVGIKPELSFLKGSKTTKVKIKQTYQKDGKIRTRTVTRSFLTKEGEITKKWGGYHGGTLRRGWTASKPKKEGDRFNTEVINHVEYAPYVEYGHRQTPGRYVPVIGKTLKVSWVPGKFMLTKAVADVKPIVPKIIEKKAKKYMKELGLDG